jgi:hypothetical protein
MNRGRPKPPWLTPAVRRYIRRVAYDFHVRAFGEEMARVNFLPLEERKAYIRDISITLARSGSGWLGPLGE